MLLLQECTFPPSTSKELSKSYELRQLPYVFSSLRGLSYTFEWKFFFPPISFHIILTVSFVYFCLKQTSDKSHELPIFWLFPQNIFIIHKKMEVDFRLK